jgi:hypothetical protein
MRRLGALLGTATAIAVGCGGTVIIPSQSSDATSGNGGATATATAASTGGVGGAGGSIFTSSSTGSTVACNDPSVFVDIVGDGVNQHYDASCAPEAHLLLPGGAKPPPPEPPPPPSGTLTITTCTVGPSLVLVLNGQSSTWPASIASASVIYYHDGAEYDASPDASGSLDVVTFEPVGGVITGAFTVTLAPKSSTGMPAKIQIAGKFRVCRGADWVPV